MAMTTINFQEMILNLERLGVWDILLPFMLVFTIVYATLSTVVWTDDNQKKFAKVIAFVIGLGVVIPHAIGAYPPGANVVEIINTALPNVALIAVAILGLFILLGLFGIDASSLGSKNIGSYIVIFCIGAIIYVFASAGGDRYRIPRALSFLNHPDTMALLITIAVFGIVVWFITREPSSGGDGGTGSKVKNFINELLNDRS
ncbi:MAG: hypothetical protein ACLFTR_02945 [Candidatus Woesearchaeota archaeon]